MNVLQIHAEESDNSESTLVSMVIRVPVIRSQYGADKAVRQVLLALDTDGTNRRDAFGEGLEAGAEKARKIIAEWLTEESSSYTAERLLSERFDEWLVERAEAKKQGQEDEQ